MLIGNGGDMEFVLFVGCVFAGMLVLALWGPRVHTFTWYNYLLVIGIPTLAVGALTYLRGIHIFKIYVAAGIIGTVAEYALGRIWHLVMGHRLYEYWRYSLLGYTSLLDIPIWGVAGVLFFLLSQAVA